MKYQLIRLVVVRMEQLVKSTKEYADWWESLDRRSRNSPLAEGNGRRTVGQVIFDSAKFSVALVFGYVVRSCEQ